MIAIIILGIVNIVLIITILLQIVFIRLKIGKDIDDDTVHVDIRRKGLNVYALTLSPTISNLCNRSGTADYIIINNLINTSFEEIYLPYYDSSISKVEQVKVKLTRKGILCVEMNDNAHQLAQDILNDDVTYLILNNYVLKILYDQKLNDEINAIIENRYPGNNRVLTFVLYSVADHLILDPSMDERKTSGIARFSMTPVIGRIENIGTRNTINIEQLLPPSTSFHVLAYSVK